MAIKKLLLNAGNLVDKKYDSERQKILFREFVEHNEFDLALDSLIELADEMDERFSLDFWLALEQAARVMKLSQYEQVFKRKINDFSINQVKPH